MSNKPDTVAMPMSPLTPTFRADRLLADLGSRGLTAQDLVKLLVAREQQGDYRFDHILYMKHWRRVSRFLETGKSSIETAAAIADVMGYATSRYVRLSALAKRNGIR